MDTYEKAGDVLRLEAAMAGGRVLVEAAIRRETQHALASAAACSGW